MNIDAVSGLTPREEDLSTEIRNRYICLFFRDSAMNRKKYSCV